MSKILARRKVKKVTLQDLHIELRRFRTRVEDLEDLRDLNAYGARFTGASFAGANLINASFVGAYLQGANFRGAHLAGVNFSGAEMSHAVGLTQGQLAQACGDESTTLPRGLRLHACA